MDKEKLDIINKIAAEFPYCIDDVTNVYIENGCSEGKTREVLTNRMITGR